VEYVETYGYFTPGSAGSLTGKMGMRPGSPVPLPLLSHVLDHSVGGPRANGTHYGPSVSGYYRHPLGYYENSGTVRLASCRPSRVPSRRNVRARRRCPTHALQCPHWASPTVQGIPRATRDLVARGGVGVETWYRRVCTSTTGHEGLGNPALTLSRRRCRAVSYTSSDTPRFPDMLLFPRPFGSR